MFTPEEALRACRTEGRAGTFSISEPAHERARAAGHSPGDLRHALARATRCEGSGTRWTVYGPSLDGTELAMVIILSDEGLSVV